jgi:hypothetical protein
MPTAVHVSVGAADVGFVRVPAVELQAYDSAEATGALAATARDTVPPTKTLVGETDTPSIVGQPTGVAPIEMLPASVDWVHRSETETAVVCPGETENGAEVPAHVTEPSVETALSETT